MYHVLLVSPKCATFEGHGMSVSICICMSTLPVSMCICMCMSTLPHHLALLAHTCALTRHMHSLWLCFALRSSQPNITDVAEGDARYNGKKGTVEWKIDLVDNSNRNGSMEFTVPNAVCAHTLTLSLAHFPHIVDTYCCALICMCTWMREESAVFGLVFHDVRLTIAFFP
jgi:hypothetical protein